MFFGAQLSYSQCSVELGADLVRCWDDPAATSLADNLVVQTPGGNAYTLTWDNGIGIDPNPQVSPATTTTYQVTMTDGAGCTATDQITVNVSHPIADAGPEIYHQCGNTPVQLDGSGSSGNLGFLVYNWDGGSVDNPNAQNPYTTISSNTSISLIVVDVISITPSFTCTSDQDQTLVLVHPTPNVDAGSDISQCLSTFPQDIDVTPNTNPSGGTWTGPDVTPAGIFTANGLGTYTLTYSFTNNNNCTGTDELDVVITQADIIDVGADIEVCLNDSPITLYNNGGTWSGSPLVTSAGIFTPSTAGNYTLTYTETSGACTSTDQLNITVFNLPQVNAGADFDLCNGSTETINGTVNQTSNPIATYQWTGANTVGPTNASSVSVNPTSQSSYTLTATDTQGCQASDDVTINVNPLPNVEAGNDINICHEIPAQTVNLVGSPTPGAGETGIWTGTGVAPNGVFTDPGAGTYILTYTFTDTNGCENTDQITITVTDPNNADVGPDLELCLNSPEVQLTQPGTWSGTDVTPSGIFTPSTVGVHLLDYQVPVGQCTAYAQLQISVWDLPQANAGQDQPLCLGNSLQLNGSGTTPNTNITNYTWTGGTNIDNPNIATPNINPTTTQTYTLTVTDDKNCTAQDNVIITVNELPIVNAGQDLTLCNQPIAEVLAGYSPLGGTWSGTGITNSTGEFTPSGTGATVVTYTYTDPITGCTNSDDITIQIDEPETIDAGNDEDLCIMDDPISLSGFIPATNITWSGTGITDPNGTFDPSISGTGAHTITLTYGSGTCLVQDTKTITVHDLPAVNAGNNQSICIDATAFDLSGATPIGGTWSGTGIVNANNGTFDPSISGEGTFELTYSYTNPATGCSNTATKTIEVLPLPISDFTLAATQCQNQELGITNNSTGGSNYSWDFGNGDTDNAATPNYSYTTPGNHTITLTTSNNGGCSNTMTQNITVVALAEANFIASELTGCGTLDVEFSNTSTGDNLTYSWDLDNGNNPLNTFNPPTTTFTETNNENHTYSVTLTASNSCNSDVATINILVQAMPIASFTTESLEYCDNLVPFNNTSVGNPTSFYWDFGGLGSSSEENPGSFEFEMGTEPLDYTITLEATNTCGTDIAQQTITILPAALTANFTTDVVSGCAPLTINVTDESNGADEYNYNFGDGGAAVTTPSPTHTYNTAGTYVINQEVANICNTDLHSITITVLALPDMSFTSTNTSFCSGQDVVFENNTTQVDNLLWTFGDGNFGYTPLASNVYDLPGEYNVNLTATSTTTGCTGTMTQSITIHQTPEALFTPTTTSGCSPFEATFINQSTGNVSTTWDFGDGTFSDQTNSSHTFVNETSDSLVFTTTMTIISAENCSNTQETEITVKPSPQINFELSEYESCDYPVTVSTINNTTLADQYSWNIFTQGTFNTSEPTVTLITPGDFPFTLIAQNNYNCTAVETQIFTVHEKPQVNYLSNINSGCSNLEVQFNNQTTGANSFVWDFGDGTQSYDNSPLHIYLHPGHYDVNLKAFSEFGCTDSLVAEGLIEVHDSPEAKFKYSPFEIDIFDPLVTFIDQSTGAQQYHWDFGDGATSVLTNPEHSYGYPGVYPVVLSVVNEFGCTDQYVEEIEVTSDVVLFIPNAFTPNNDGFNDYFKPSILGKEFTAEYLFQVYNRWGQVIFQTTDPEQGWDGEVYDGEYYVPEGEYNWHLEFRLKTNVKKEVQNGSVYMFK